MRLKEGKQYRLKDKKSGIIRDIFVLKLSHEYYECFSSIVNINKPTRLDLDFYNKIGLHEMDLNSIFEVNEVETNSSFIEFKNIYNLFKEAKKVHLIAKLTIYSEFEDSSPRNYLYNVIYLKIDNVFTEIVFSSRIDMLSDILDINYVYVFQGDFLELSLNILKEFENCEIQYFHKDITPYKLSTIEDNVIGVHLHEFILHNRVGIINIRKSI